MARPEPKPFFVFVSSPGDVAEERAHAVRVIEELRAEPLLRDEIFAIPMAWDIPGLGAAVTAEVGPQTSVNNTMRRPSECDVVLVVLAGRLGTRLPANERKPNGQPYRSGTEWEFLDALRHDDYSRRPNVLVYRKVELPPIDPLGLNATQLRAQRRLVEEFFSEFVHPDGSMAGGYYSYRTCQEFAARLPLDLKALIRERLRQQREQTHSATPAKGGVANRSIHDPGAPSGLGGLGEVGGSSSAASGSAATTGKVAPAVLPLIDSRATAERERLAAARAFEGETFWVNQWGMRFSLIPPGRSYLGAAPGDTRAASAEQPRSAMVIPHAFWMATTSLPVAVVQDFLAAPVDAQVRGMAALQQDRAFASRIRKGLDAPDGPAVEISGLDVRVLAAWMERQDGIPYRLPTEAEWEYAARAGALGRVWWLDHENGNTKTVVGNEPAPPDRRRANPWGLIDVLGNVWEWTASPFSPFSSGGANRAAGVLDGEGLAIRGGGWRDPTDELRLSMRQSRHRARRLDDLGARLAITLARLPP